MLFRIETDLHISDLLKLTNDVTCDILIYPLAETMTITKSA